ncbi:hypothetical protein WHI96_11475 [Pseudonocardia tropica]|uniref:Uncharacterized protein n=1 Tax=Pseudonocardia tropica TaxID=681289 RepID=A0ABV1JU17_9PSEU
MTAPAPVRVWFGDRTRGYVPDLERTGDVPRAFLDAASRLGMQPPEGLAARATGPLFTLRRVEVGGHGSHLCLTEQLVGKDVGRAGGCVFTFAAADLADAADLWPRTPPGVADTAATARVTDVLRTLHQRPDAPVLRIPGTPAEASAAIGTLLAALPSPLVDGRVWASCLTSVPGPADRSSFVTGGWSDGMRRDLPDAAASVDRWLDGAATPSPAPDELDGRTERALSWLARRAGQGDAHTVVAGSASLAEVVRHVVRHHLPVDRADVPALVADGQQWERLADSAVTVREFAGLDPERAMELVGPVTAAPAGRPDRAAEVLSALLTGIADGPGPDRTDTGPGLSPPPLDPAHPPGWGRTLADALIRVEPDEHQRARRVRYWLLGPGRPLEPGDLRDEAHDWLRTVLPDPAAHPEVFELRPAEIARRLLDRGGVEPWIVTRLENDPDRTALVHGALHRLPDAPPPVAGALVRLGRDCGMRPSEIADAVRALLDLDTPRDGGTGWVSAAVEAVEAVGPGARTLRAVIGLLLGRLDEWGEAADAGTLRAWARTVLDDPSAAGVQRTVARSVLADPVPGPPGDAVAQAGAVVPARARGGEPVRRRFRPGGRTAADPLRDDPAGDGRGTGARTGGTGTPGDPADRDRTVGGRAHRSHPGAARGGAPDAEPWNTGAHAGPGRPGGSARASRPRGATAGATPGAAAAGAAVATGWSLLGRLRGWWRRDPAADAADRAPADPDAGSGPDLGATTRLPVFRGDGTAPGLARDARTDRPGAADLSGPADGLGPTDRLGPVDHAEPPGAAAGPDRAVHPDRSDRRDLPDRVDPDSWSRRPDPGARTGAVPAAGPELEVGRPRRIPGAPAAGGRTTARVVAVVAVLLGLGVIVAGLYWWPGADGPSPSSPPASTAPGVPAPAPSGTAPQGGAPSSAGTAPDTAATPGGTVAPDGTRPAGGAAGTGADTPGGAADPASGRGTEVDR